MRQRLNSDYIHFVSKKHKVSFKLKKEVGHFVVNNGATLQYAEKLLQENRIHWLLKQIGLYNKHFKN
jgi:hypothetical protein